MVYGILLFTADLGFGCNQIYGRLCTRPSNIWSWTRSRSGRSFRSASLLFASFQPAWIHPHNDCYLHVSTQSHISYAAACTSRQLTLRLSADQAQEARVQSAASKTSTRFEDSAYGKHIFTSWGMPYGRIIATATPDQSDGRTSTHCAMH